MTVSDFSQVLATSAQTVTGVALSSQTVTTEAVVKSDSWMSSSITKVSE